MTKLIQTLNRIRIDESNSVMMLVYVSMSDGSMAAWMMDH
jgi:hypothetical protein